MQVSLLIGFAFVSLALIAVPGPDWAFVLSVGARERAVVKPVLGITAGYLAVTIAVVIGLGPLIEVFPAFLTILTVASSAYLLYLGVTTLRSSGQAQIVASNETKAKKSRGLFLRGMAVSGFNPKALLVLLATLPQFTTAGGWSIPVQFLVLGGIYTALSAVLYFGLGIAASRVLGAKPGFAVVTSRIAGISMVLVAIALIVERFV
jgi:threonine/homoserine/homoserine lactone efflux protein